jgi:uncharacterized lipoprotein YmbA
MNRAQALLSRTTVSILLALVIPWTGCLGPGTTRPTRFFVLSATANPAATSERTTDLRLSVGRVLLPDLLNRPQIVTRTGENQVRLADFAQWAEPLETSLPRVISEDLARLTGTDQVSVHPWPSPMKIDLRVEIAVLQFEGNRDGEVSLVARWRWVRADGSEAHPLQLSSHLESAADRSTEALVAAMNRALGSLSRDIAAAIATLSP